MYHHDYLNDNTLAKSDNQPAIINVRRAKAIYDPSKPTEVAIDRFTLEGVLPLFDVQSGGIISFKNIATNVVTSQAVDWTPKGVNGYLYNYRFVADAITTAFASLCSTLGIVSPNIPTCTYDEKTKLFSIHSAVTGFQDTYKMLFDTDMYRFLNSFEFSEENTTYELLLNEATETQNISTLEYLSPVKRLVIQTDLSVEQELLPAPKQRGVDGPQVDQFDSSFLVDYLYVPTDSNSLKSIQYIAENEHRWHNMIDGTMTKQFTLTFLWYDRYDTGRQILMKKGDYASVKLYFRQPLY